MGTMPSQIIPSGRARGRRSRATSLAARVTAVTFAALVALAMLDTPVVALALIALIVLGSVLILTDPSIEKRPPMPLT